MKRRLVPILTTSGGVLVAAGIAILVDSGAFRRHPHLAYWCLAAGVILLVIAVFLAALKKPEQDDPAQLKITPGKLRKFAMSSTGERDILFPVKVELLRPIEVEVKGCSVELSLHRITESMEVKNDIGQYDAHDRRPNTPPRALVPLPARLRSGHPVEVWVHFVTTRNEYEIQSNQLTLIMHTSCGNGNKIIPSSSQYWDEGRETFIARRF